MVKQRKSFAAIGTGVFTAAACLNGAAAILEENGLPRHKEPYTDAEMQTYGQEVLTFSAGGGVGLSIVLGFILFISTIVFCCKCCKRNKAERLLQEEGDDAASKYGVAGEEELAARKIRSRRTLWIGCVLVVLAYLACAGAAYKAATDSQKTVDSAFTDTITFFEDVQDALCSKDSGDNCTAGSLGDYIGSLQDYVDGVFEDLDDVAAGILSDLTTRIGYVAGNASLVSDELAKVTAALTAINATSYAAADPMADAYSYSSGDIDFNTPVVQDEDIAAIDTASDAASSAANESSNSLGPVTSALDSTTAQAESSRAAIDDEADHYIEKLASYAETVGKTKHRVVNIQLDANDYASQVTYIVGGFIFIPGLLLLLAMLFGATCRSPKPFYCNMTFVFLAQGIFCLIAGLFLVLVKVDGDVCDAHRDLLRLNAPDNQTIGTGGTEYTIDFRDSVLPLLDCDGFYPDAPTSKNNAFNILKLGPLVNASVYGQLEPVVDQLQDVTGFGSAVDSVRSGQSSLSGIDSATAVNCTKGFNAVAAQAQLDAYLATETPGTAFYVALTELTNDVTYWDGNLTALSDAQAAILELQTIINATMANMLTAVATYEDMVSGLVPDVLGVAKQALTADEYTMCGFVGAFYTNVYMQSVCGDLLDSANMVSAAALGVVCLMLVSFCLQGCHAHSMRRSRVGATNTGKIIAGYKQDATGPLNYEEEQALQAVTPPRSPASPVSPHFRGGSHVSGGPLSPSHQPMLSTGTLGSPSNGR